MSTNNGVFLCLSCCAKHRSLGTNISKIKSIMHVEWDFEEIEALQKGGNRSFNDFMTAYNLHDAPVTSKYFSKAADYYRTMLRGYIDGMPLDELPPTKTDGTRLLNGLSPVKNTDLSNKHDISPIHHKKDSSIDLSRSSFSIRENERNYDHKWANNSILVNKSVNVSRYSINIEAQNDLNRITILLNDEQTKGKPKSQISLLKNIFYLRYRKSPK